MFLYDKLHLECFLHCVKWQDKVSVLGYVVVVQLHFRHLSFISPPTSIRLAVLAAFQIQLVLRQVSVIAVHVEAAGAAAAAAQERTDGPALTSVTHSVAEHFVDLLLWRHPPVRVWGTVHPDELWQEQEWGFTGDIAFFKTEITAVMNNLTEDALSLHSHYKDWGSVKRVSLKLYRLKHLQVSKSTLIRGRTSEAADFDGVQWPSLQARLPWVDRALPFTQTAGELELVRGEDVADQVAQQSPAVFLWGVDSFVPLLVSDEEWVVLQELFTALQGRGQRTEDVTTWSVITADVVLLMHHPLLWVPIKRSHKFTLKSLMST